MLPTNSYQMRQMPISLTIFTVGIVGGITAVTYLLPVRYIPRQ